MRVIKADELLGRLWLSTLESHVLASVEEVHSYGLRMSTPMGPGFLYATELNDYVEDCGSKYVVGQSLRVRAMGEMEEGLLALSMKSFEARFSWRNHGRIMKREAEQSEEVSAEASRSFLTSILVSGASARCSRSSTQSHQLRV